MPLLKPALQKELRNALSAMTSPVTIAVFTTDTGQQSCEMCEDTRQLIEELAWLSDGRITVQPHDLVRDADRAAALRIDKAPAVVVLGRDGADPGVRFYGIPSGYEFASLVSAVLMVSSGDPSLTRQSIDALAGLQLPMHIQVFVTPTCPYCPSAVTLAHKLALASPHVTAEMIDASEFPELADRFNVRAVPHSVINGAIHIEGAVPEQELIARLTAAK